MPAKGTKTTAEKKTTATKKPAAPRKPRKAKPEAGSVGLTAEEVAGGDKSSEITKLEKQIEAAGGHVLAAYREPYGGHWVALAALPLDKVVPTPYQRELSKTHAERLAAVIPKVGRFLDPVIAVPDGDKFISPNGMHRLSAMTSLGAKTAIALVMPEPEIAFRILALNTEKAHAIKDKSLEVIRMARAIADDKTGRSEADMAFEFELPMFLPLGVCYERNGRFSGGAYSSVVRATVDFSSAPMTKSLETREHQADLLLELDKHVAEAVERLKKAGWTSGYLKAIVVGRINPLRFVKLAKDAPKPDFDKTIEKMIDAAKKFDPSKIKAQDLAIAAASGGSGEGEGD
jgi:ParB family transcriptional regulator, chromosome partitioning protein